MPHSTAPLPTDALLGEEATTFQPQRLAYLAEVLTGASSGKAVPVVGTVVVGTDEGCTLVLADATVSRRHLTLERQPEGVWVRDTGSKNGTFLNGMRVDGFLVRREATFSVAGTVMRVSGSEPTPTAPSTSFGEALGASPVMQALFESLRRAAPTASNVLLLGETGTGKDVLARAIHAASPRRHRPFVVVDCSGLTPSLIESELFGHARGAFTGAATERQGAFVSAAGGTIFLDEVGELPLALQPKLLRVLESRTVRRVGEDRDRPVDVRVIAATHRDLRKHVELGSFREDLFFRLAVIVAAVPPLRQRREDLPMLVTAMLARAGRPNFELSQPLLDHLARHEWPGNVRELRNVIERAVGGVEFEAPAAPSEPPRRVFEDLPYKDAKQRLIEEFTREYFERLFEASQGSVAEMARQAGIARTYAHEVVKKYNLK